MSRSRLTSAKMTWPRGSGRGLAGKVNACSTALQILLEMCRDHDGGAGPTVECTPHPRPGVLVQRTGRLVDHSAFSKYAGETVQVENRTAVGHGQSLAGDSGGRVARMHVRSVTARLGARVLIASRGIDQLYSWFDRLRSELVAALASEEMLDRYNEIAYGGTPRYQPRSGAFR